MLWSKTAVTLKNRLEPGRQALLHPLGLAPPPGKGRGGQNSVQIYPRRVEGTSQYFQNPVCTVNLSLDWSREKQSEAAGWTVQSCLKRDSGGEPLQRALRKAFCDCTPQSRRQKEKQSQVRGTALSLPARSEGHSLHVNFSASQAHSSSSV